VVLPDGTEWENQEQIRPEALHPGRPHGSEPEEVSAEPEIAGHRVMPQLISAAERLELPAAVSLVRAAGAVVRSPQREVAGDEARDLSEVAVSDPVHLREPAEPGARPGLLAMAAQVHLRNARDGPACSPAWRLRSQAGRPELPVMAALVQRLLELDLPERDG